MKKLQMIATLALCAAASIVSAQSVTSQNIVGYKQEVRPEGAWLQSIQFSPVGADPQAASSLSNVLDYATVSDLDQLWVYDAGIGDFHQFQMISGQWNSVEDNQNYDILLKPGNAVLLNSFNTLDFYGQVPSITNYVHHLDGSGAYLMGSAIPAASTLANFDWASSVSDLDQLWIYDAGIGDFHQYQWIANGWYSVDDNSLLPFSTDTSNGFLLSTGATTLTQSLSI